MNESKALLAAGILLLLAGCEGSDAVSTSDPRPAHPAMNRAPSTAAAPAPTPDLPPGHPAVGGSPEAMPEGHPAVATPAAPAAPAAPSTSPAAAAAPAAAPAGGVQVDVGPIALIAPEGWVRRQAPQFILAEFKLPRSDGDAEDGRVTVSSAGGGVEQNIQRWQGQFQDSSGAKVEKKDVNGLKATIARIEGTFKGMGGPMVGGGGPGKPNYRMWGVVIQVPDQDTLIFLKATGPAKTLEHWQASLDSFLSSAHPTGA